MALEAPVVDASRSFFVGYCALPIRHGLTVGELAAFAPRRAPHLRYPEGTPVSPP